MASCRNAESQIFPDGTNKVGAIGKNGRGIKERAQMKTLQLDETEGLREQVDITFLTFRTAGLPIFSPAEEKAVRGRIDCCVFISIYFSCIAPHIDTRNL